MENFEFLLKRRRRLLRRDLIGFLDALSLQLQVGYDLAYGWPETLAALDSQLGPDMRTFLRPLDDEAMSATLTRLAGAYPVEAHRHWFHALLDRYVSGASVLESVRAIATYLRKEQERDFEAHCRTLPSKLNVLLILFFLPPTFLLLFVPLILEIIQGFR